MATRGGCYPPNSSVMLFHDCPEERRPVVSEVVQGTYGASLFLSCLLLTVRFHQPLQEYYRPSHPDESFVQHAGKTGPVDNNSTDSKRVDLGIFTSTGQDRTGHCSTVQCRGGREKENLHAQNIMIKNTKINIRMKPPTNPRAHQHAVNRCP